MALGRRPRLVTFLVLVTWTSQPAGTTSIPPPDLDVAMDGHVSARVGGEVAPRPIPRPRRRTALGAVRHPHNHHLLQTPSSNPTWSTSTSARNGDMTSLEPIARRIARVKDDITQALEPTSSSSETTQFGAGVRRAGGRTATPRHRLSCGAKSCPVAQCCATSKKVRCTLLALHDRRVA